MVKQSLVTAAKSAAPATTAAKSGGTLVNMPPSQGMITVVQEVSNAPYVAFAHPMSPQWGAMSQQIPGLDEGDIVLVPPAPVRSRRLSPLRFFLLNATQYWGTFSADGSELLAATFQKPDERGEWKEQIECVVIVAEPDGKLTPANIGFRTTKTRCAHRAIETLNGIIHSPEEWAALGADHKLTMNFPQAWMRFACQGKNGKRKTGARGFAYTPLLGLIFPTTVPEADALVRAFGDEEFQKTFAAVQDRYKMRVESVMGKSK